MKIRKNDDLLGLANIEVIGSWGERLEMIDPRIEPTVHPSKACIPTAERAGTPAQKVSGMSIRNLIVLGSIVVSSSQLASGGARADEGTAAQAFVEQERHQLEQLLHQPDTAARKSQIHQAMASFFDYDELTRRAFGNPCPALRSFRYPGQP